MIYKTQHIELKIEQQELHLKRVWTHGAPEGYKNPT